MAIGDICLYQQTDFAEVMGTTLWVTGAGVGVLDVVKVDPLNDDTVIPADADGDPAEPAIGVVIALDVPTVGSCIVKSLGVTTGFGGLTRGKRYILSKSAGGIIAADDNINPDYPVSGDFKQTIGVARSATELMVMVDPTTFELP